MGEKDTLETRLKQIRKELSLIDKDLKSLSGAAAETAPGKSTPRLHSRELREKIERKSTTQVKGTTHSETLSRKPAKTFAPPSAGAKMDKDGRFLDYLSSSFDSSRPLGQERRIQRNKAVLMLIIVLFVLFLVLYRKML